ncbi:hypothetical protein CPC08DRAFT_725287 [Agrocybe pediades]|nr:hypothetical protein CPC08DRAFT_725287 [Agrocybe pediades]
MSIYHRPLPTRSSSASSVAPSVGGVSSRAATPALRHSPLLPGSTPGGSHGYPVDKHEYAPLHHHQQQQQQVQLQQQQQPTICGLPLKYVSLVTLAVQNAALSIVMHYSRVSTPPSLSYSPASAVLLNEILKGSISFIVALSRSPLLNQPQQQQYPLTRRGGKSISSTSAVATSRYVYLQAFTHLCQEIFSPDCWKLSIPAILYVIQNSLQFVAISNLPVASFQVTYQMKILTTAAFSVVLLRKKLSSVKWLSLFFLAMGVGVVQIQNATGTSGGSGSSSGSGGGSMAVGSAHDFHAHVMNPMKGFGAVTAACFTSGLAGVYFEMVLKGSKADLWVRNVQLSLFSLIPALLPILYNYDSSAYGASSNFLHGFFRNFGWWAWATVAIQVFGGLVTAIVIKYSDNILKGFATSLSIVFSFLASVALFDFRITPSFVIGASTVLCATWMYNQPANPGPSLPPPSTAPSSANNSPLASPTLKSSFEKDKEAPFAIVLNDAFPTDSGRSSPSPYYPGTPVNIEGGPSSDRINGSSDPNGNGSGVLGGLGVGSFMRRKSGGFGERSGSALGFGSRNSSTGSLSALLSAGMDRVPSPLGVSGTSTPAVRGELGRAESGEFMHPPPPMITVDVGPSGRASEEEYFASPFSSRAASRLPSRVPSRASSPGPGQHGGLNSNSSPTAMNGPKFTRTSS